MLDVRNPRIELLESASQPSIRLKLLDLEGVLELARSIEKSNGLFYGERIITVIESGKSIVLEGNRRVAACQMLLTPSLVPQQYRLRFPVASAATKLRIKRISADVAPDRVSAEPILTKRHTEQGAKPWSPVAKMRRAVRLLNSLSVDEVAQVLGTSPAQVRKLVRPYKLLRYAFGITAWNEDERQILENEKLKTNPYTRFFTLAKTLEVLQARFDDDQNIISALPANVFREQIEKIARDFLIPDAMRGRPRCDTRTDPVSYFSDFVNSPAGKIAAAEALLVKQNGYEKKGEKTAVVTSEAETKGNRDPAKISNEKNESENLGNKKNSSPKGPKASIFFEHLECHVIDNNLIKLTLELCKINHEKMPIAASLLTRSVFECALVHKIKAMDKWNDLITAEGKDPGLTTLIKFCAKFTNGVFAEQNICKTLQSHTTMEAKNYLDAMTHLKYQEADSSTLESVANNLRQVIKYILDGN